MGLRYIILYRKTGEEEKPLFKVVRENNDVKAIKALCIEENIPMNKIEYTQQVPGIYSCRCLDDYYGVD